MTTTPTIGTEANYAINETPAWSERMRRRVVELAERCDVVCVQVIRQPGGERLLVVSGAARVEPLGE